MINLLPAETKRQIRAARTNVILIRYIIIIISAVLFLGLVIFGIYLILSNMKTDAEQTITSNSDGNSQYGSIQAQAEALKNSVQGAKSVLDSEIVYTKLIASIAAATPKGVILDKLALNGQTIGTATTIQAYAKSTEAALALKDSYQGSPIFSNVIIQNISSSNGVTGYPVNIVLGVTINKGAAR